MAMKLQNNIFLLKLSTVIKILALVLISFGSFYLGKQWSQSDGSQSLRRFPFHPDNDSESVSIFQSLNGFFNPSSSELNDNVSNSFHPLEDEEREEAFFDSIYTAAPEGKLVVKKMGVLDENGVMKEDFDVGDFDRSVVEGFEERNDERMAAKKVEVKKFGMCLNSKREYIPCLDNLEAINKSNSTDKNEVFERHCPGPGFGLNCLIPAPKGYKSPIPWPNCRDEIWFNNVPHTCMIEDKGGKNWITISGNKFKFPGGHGADQYLDQIEKMAPEIAFGKHVRVVLDIGCGIASFGAYLFSRNVLTLSVAPKGVHDNQIQFALERGVPAMVTPFATRRLPYPSQAFDLIHHLQPGDYHIQINWTRDDGVLLLEVNRLLRAGGYFVWALQPVDKYELLLQEQLEVMVNLTSRLCWNLVKKEGYIAIWQKPLNNVCYLSRKEGTQPPLCEPYDDPDKVWYVDMKSCITRLPEEGLGSNVTIWPARLQSPPDRLQSLQLDAYISRKELFKADKKFWDEIVEGYIRIMGWKSDKFRNVLDMRAGYGGFAAALIENDVDCWVLNVVPVSGPNTLPVIYDRGLIGVTHDWCEPFDTFPRTYDLLHAAGLFSVERKRCKIASIMLEMDRILRPGGRVYIRDTVAVVDEVEATGKAMGWHVTVRDTEDGPRSSYRILVCNKILHIQ